MGIAQEASAIAGELISLRHALHRHPELGLQLPDTQGLLLDALDGIPLEVTLGTDCTSIVGVMRGGSARRDGVGAPVVLLRADMDAYAVQEETDLPYSSRRPGIMHACGHDTHMAMLVGAARLLDARRESLPGDIVLMFQPGEESWGGATRMIEAGVLEAAGRRVDAAYGIHAFASTVPTGVFATRSGPMLASDDFVRVVIHGRGGHGSAPHTGRDPVVVAAEIVLALQVMVTRQFRVFDPVVVTVGSIHAGQGAYDIPVTAELEATVHSFSSENRHRIEVAIMELVNGLARAHDVTAEITYVHGSPVTVNDEAQVRFLQEVVTDLYGEDAYQTLPTPFAGSIDFSYLLEQVPGAFLGIGAVPPHIDPRAADSNHSPRAQYDDSIIERGAAVLAEVAVRRLQELAS